jgi:Ca-activated chloride channel homolog
MLKTKLFIVLLSVITAFTTVFAQKSATPKAVKPTIIGTVTDANGKAIVGASIAAKGIRSTLTKVGGKYELNLPVGKYTFVCAFAGYLSVTKPDSIVKGKVKTLNFVLTATAPPSKEPVSNVRDKVIFKKEMEGNSKSMPHSYAAVGKMKAKTRSYSGSKPNKNQVKDAKFMRDSIAPTDDFNTEEYGNWIENSYKSPKDEALSTFSIDVDRASYANIRRFIEGGTKPPSGAVRIEEMVNYFDYNYPQPTDKHPLSIISEMGTCPWQKDHFLLHIGLQGKKIDMKQAPRNNLVFLIDVSGSMESPQKLPLVKEALKVLINNLRDEDHIALVVYAGAAGCVLPSTSGAQKAKILEALDNLNAGGSTAGGAGIQLAYKIAKDNFVKGGNNRIILASDGDFNVGVSSDSELTTLIEEKRKEGVSLSVLGFGRGNYKDSKMEMLADKGNGNYAYIDKIEEAQKVFGKEMGATLYTIAKDVKLQVEFNPSVVAAYRLIGYENRLLNKEDFNDDTKDAGDIGAGHTVTALYEIIPIGVPTTALETPSVDKLKFQETTIKNNSKDMVFVKLRYKNPDTDKSILMEQTVDNQHFKLDQTSANFKFSAAVAGFGQILRGSKFTSNFDYKKARALALNSLGADTEGYRAAFVKLIEKAEGLPLTSKK